MKTGGKETRGRLPMSDYEESEQRMLKREIDFFFSSLKIKVAFRSVNVRVKIEQTQLDITNIQRAMNYHPQLGAQVLGG